MCGLMKCCINCKYYEHVRALDDEADWCHYPNHEGIISNDPDYVKSELSGHCKYYEPITAQPPYDVGDRVLVKGIEGRSSYMEVRGKMGTIVKVERNDYFDKITYTFKVKMDKYYNEYQQEGLYVFNKINSLELIASTSKERIMKSTAEKIMENSVFGRAAFDPICTEPSIIDQYAQKKSKVYEQEREDTIRKLNEASPVGKAITNFIVALKKAGLKDEMLPDFQMLWNDNCLTDAEKAAIKAVHSDYHLAMSKLHETCRNCAAVFVNCQTFEQKMDVLQKFDIIDGNYKLKI